MKITQPINKYALMLATFSFLLGTILLLLHFIIDGHVAIVFGLYYVIMATALNSIMLVCLLINMITNQYLYRENITTVLTFLLNIPIAIGYFFIVITI